jgi:hypothetical protein
MREVSAWLRGLVRGEPESESPHPATIPGPDGLTPLQHESDRAFTAAIESTGLTIRDRRLSRATILGNSVVVIVLRVVEVPLIATMGRDFVSVISPRGTGIQIGMIDYDSVEAFCAELTGAVTAEATRLRDGVPAPPRRSPPPLPTPVPLSPLVRSVVVERYPPPHGDEVASLLEHTRLGFYDKPCVDRDRVQLAILKRANGDLERLRSIALGPKDFRDLLVWSGLAQPNWREVLRDAGYRVP